MEVQRIDRKDGFWVVGCGTSDEQKQRYATCGWCVVIMRLVVSYASLKGDLRKIAMLCSMRCER